MTFEDENRFRYKVAQVVYRARRWNDQLWGPRGRRLKVKDTWCQS